MVIEYVLYKASLYIYCLGRRDEETEHVGVSRIWVCVCIVCRKEREEDEIEMQAGETMRKAED